MKVLCPKCRLFKRGRFHHSKEIENHGGSTLTASGGSYIDKYYKIGIHRKGRSRCSGSKKIVSSNVSSIRSYGDKQ